MLLQTETRVQDQGFNGRNGLFDARGLTHDSRKERDV